MNQPPTKRVIHAPIEVDLTIGPMRSTTNEGVSENEYPDGSENDRRDFIDALRKQYHDVEPERGENGSLKMQPDEFAVVTVVYVLDQTTAPD
jgi:hypothetical protein